MFVCKEKSRISFVFGRSKGNFRFTQEVTVIKRDLDETIFICLKIQSDFVVSICSFLNPTLLLSYVLFCFIGPSKCHGKNFYKPV